MAEVQGSIFPEIKVVTPRVLCECVGSAIVRIAKLGTETELCTSNHIRREVDPRPAANEVIN